MPKGKEPDKKAEPKEETLAEISKAPPPVEPVKASASGGDNAKVDSGGNFTGSFAEYKALRKAKKI